MLLIGGGEPGGYVLGYLGLTAVGAAVGVLVNVLLPSLPLATADAAQAELRALLADQLDDLADGLRQESLPRSTEWEARARDLLTPARSLESLVARADEAQRANWRARRWQDSARSTVTHGRALRWLSYEVEEILRTLARDEHAERDQVALGPLLRPAAAARSSPSPRCCGRWGRTASPRTARPTPPSRASPRPCASGSAPAPTPSPRRRSSWRRGGCSVRWTRGSWSPPGLERLGGGGPPTGGSPRATSSMGRASDF